MFPELFKAPNNGGHKFRIYDSLSPALMISKAKAGNDSFFARHFTFDLNYLVEEFNLVF